jgi:hypothetical protein
VDHEIGSEPKAQSHMHIEYKYIYSTYQFKDLIPLPQYYRKLLLKLHPHGADWRGHLSRDFYCTVDHRGRLSNGHDEK